MDEFIPAPVELFFGDQPDTLTFPIVVKLYEISSSLIPPEILLIPLFNKTVYFVSFLSSVGLKLKTVSPSHDLAPVMFGLMLKFYSTDSCSI